MVITVSGVSSMTSMKSGFMVKETPFNFVMLIIAFFLIELLNYGLSYYGPIIRILENERVVPGTLPLTSLLLAANGLVVHLVSTDSTS